MVFPDFGDGLFHFTLPGEVGGGNAHGFPVGADGIDDGAEHEAFDIGAGGVVGTELVTFDGVERAFEQGAEDGGLDIAPVGAGGFDEQPKLVLSERQRGAFGKQPSVKLEYVGAQRGGEAAGVHLLPQLLDHRHKMLRGVGQAFEQVGEAVAHEQPDILGKHGEEAAHQEGGGLVGGMPVGFERYGERGEVVGNLAGDACAALGGVEFQGLEPELPQAFADIGAFEVAKENTVTAGSGKRDVGSAGAGKLGVEFDGVADIDHNQKRRATLLGRQRADVLLGLAAGTQHGVVPRHGAALGGSFLQLLGGFQRIDGLGSIGSLLGFEHEVTALVEVDPPGAAGAVAMGEGDIALKNIGVQVNVRRGGVRRRDVEQNAEFGKEALAIGAFRRA